MYRRQKPDVFEMMIFARTRVFVRIVQGEYLVVTAITHGLSVMRWCKGDAEPASILYYDQGFGLFDGNAWDVEALNAWVKAHCPVCGLALDSKRKIYCSDKCKQKAYRERSK